MLRVQIVDENGAVVVPDTITTLTSLEVTVSALPAGAATQTTLAALLAAIGAKSDVAWTGTGDGSVIAILKAIAINTGS